VYLLWLGWVAGMGWGGRAWGVGSGIRGPNNNILLASLIDDNSLNAGNLLNGLLHDDENIQQFFNTNISSDYHDLQSFISKFKGAKEPLFISVNIQSLNSKFNELKLFVNELKCNDIEPDMLILQETWNINFPELCLLPDFQPLIFS